MRDHVPRAERGAGLHEPLLRDVADAAVSPADGLAEERHAAARQRLLAEDGPEQRGLAGAVRSEDRDELPRRDVEVESVPELPRAVREPGVAEREHGGTATARCSGGPFGCRDGHFASAAFTASMFACCHET
jgi:hypothetical protein